MEAGHGAKEQVEEWKGRVMEQERKQEKEVEQARKCQVLKEQESRGAKVHAREGGVCE